MSDTNLANVTLYKYTSSLKTKILTKKICLHFESKIKKSHNAEIKSKYFVLKHFSNLHAFKK